LKTPARSNLQDRVGTMAITGKGNLEKKNGSAQREEEFWKDKKENEPRLNIEEQTKTRGTSEKNGKNVDVHAKTGLRSCPVSPITLYIDGCFRGENGPGRDNKTGGRKRRVLHTKREPAVGRGVHEISALSVEPLKRGGTRSGLTQMRVGSQADLPPGFGGAKLSHPERALYRHRATRETDGFPDRKRESHHTRYGGLNQEGGGT